MSRFAACDTGTWTLVLAKRQADGTIEYKKEINAFVEIPLDHRYMFNLLQTSKVKMIEDRAKNVAYVVGQSAVNLAYSMPQLELRRPMAGGCLNPKEKDAFFVLSTMLHNLIGEVDEDKTQLFYSIPANAVNEFSDATYHQKVLEAMFKKYEVNGKTIESHPMNEALAIIFAEAEEKQFTALAISFGSGMSNVCSAMYSIPIFQFSVVNSGDFIDLQASRATNESISLINREKMKTDLTKQPSSSIERAIHTQYRIMIEKTVAGIKKGIEANSNKFNLDVPIDIIISGGTSTPNGFEQLFQDVLMESKIPINIGQIRKPKDTLLTVAKGLLIAAENSLQH